MLWQRNSQTDIFYFVLYRKTSSCCNRCVSNVCQPSLLCMCVTLVVPWWSHTTNRASLLCIFLRWYYFLDMHVPGYWALHIQILNVNVPRLFVWLNQSSFYVGGFTLPIRFGVRWTCYWYSLVLEYPFFTKYSLLVLYSCMNALGVLIFH